MSLKTFIIKGMRTDSVALEHGDLSRGFPSATAWAGYANALCRALDGPDWDFSVIPVIHRLTERSGMIKSEMFPKSNKFTATAEREKTQGVMEFSLVLMTNHDVSSGEIFAKTRLSRISGSAVFSTPDSEHAEVEDAKTGLLMIGRGHDVGRAILPSLNPLVWVQDRDRVIAALTLTAERPETGCQALISPIGYRRIRLDALNRDGKIRGARSGGPYVAVEPVMGIIDAWPVSRNGVPDEVLTDSLGGFMFIPEMGTRGDTVEEIVVVHRNYAEHIFGQTGGI